MRDNDNGVRIQFNSDDGSVRPYIVYDLNNTGYFWNGDNETRMFRSEAQRGWGTWVQYDANDTYYRVDPNGLSIYNDLRANIFYDINTAYYLDPNSSTSLRTAGSYSIDGNTVIDDGAGWHRSYGQTGWYNGSYGGGWYMADGTWIRMYGNKSVLSQRNGYPAFRGDSYSCSYYASENYGCGPYNAAQYNSGYVYSYTYYSYSTREKKKEIERFSTEDYASSLDFIDNLELSFYRFKDDEGYNKVHVGLIAEDAPTTLTAPGQTGVSYTELAAFNSAAVKGLKHKLDQIESEPKNISDFGVGEIASDRVRITFNDEFGSELGSSTPIVTVTPLQAGVALGVSGIDQNGFYVESENLHGSVMFNWIAMAKVQPSVPSVRNSDYSPRFKAMLESAENDTRPVPTLSDTPDQGIEDPTAPWAGGMYVEPEEIENQPGLEDALNPMTPPTPDMNEAPTPVIDKPNEIGPEPEPHLMDPNVPKADPTHPGAMEEERSKSGKP
jgi:hypothetical protein